MPCVALAHCFEQAGQRYGVPSELLRAIAVVESAGQAHVVNRSHESRTGSRDIGLMQVNSRWLPLLKQFGIDEAVLLNDACINVHVGAWVLSDLFARYGAGWEAVGAYNAACSTLKGEACARARRSYAWRVYRALSGAGQPGKKSGQAAVREPRLATATALPEKSPSSNGGAAAERVSAAVGDVTPAQSACASQNGSGQEGSGADGCAQFGRSAS